MQTVEKNNETKRSLNNCLRKCFHSFKYIIDHANVLFFFYVNNLLSFVWFPLYYLLHHFSSDCLADLTCLLFEYINFFKSPAKKNVWWCKLMQFGKCLLRNQRKDRAGGAFIEHLESQILKSLSLGNHRSAFVGFFYVLVCPKNSGYVTDRTPSYSLDTP